MPQTSRRQQLSDPRISDGPSGEESAQADDEEVSLAPEERQEVTDLHGRLEELDYYALLGVDPAADVKTVKRAYFKAAAKFHPDRHFRKKLGPFKIKMETIFSSLTLAHDTLSDRARRAEYDAYMQAQIRSRGIEDLLADSIAEVRRVEEDVERQVRMSALSGPGGTPPTETVAVGPTGDPSTAKLGEPPPGKPATDEWSPPKAAKSPSPVVDAAARRDALARRLLGGRRVPTVSSAPAPQASAQPRPKQTPTEAMDALRRRFEERVLQAKAAQARAYVEKAKEALARGDPVAAANSLRVANNLAPQDAEIDRLSQEAQAKANVIVGQTYTQQAEYEEKNGRWAQAARSWTRVCGALANDVRAHERAANAILKASGDLHQAAALGRRACELQPGSPGARVTLASVYLAAGLTLNARRELDTAAQLAPHDDTIREMIRQSNRTA
jgi:curved DNA-binding protein CbpA